MRHPSSRLLPLLALVVGACASPGARPGPPTVWRDLAAAHEARRAGDGDAALDRLRAILARDPAEREVRRELGLRLAAAGRPDAGAVLAPLAARDPVDAEVLVALARTALRSGDAETAARHLARLASSPGAVGVDAYLVSAELALERGNPDAAGAAFRQALVLDPGRPEALLGLARLADERGDEAARTEAREALRRSCPGHPALR